jgi:hypothetical protein
MLGHHDLLSLTGSSSLSSGPFPPSGLPNCSSQRRLGGTARLHKRRHLDLLPPPHETSTAHVPGSEPTSHERTRSVQSERPGGRTPGGGTRARRAAGGPARRHRPPRSGGHRYRTLYRGCGGLWSRRKRRSRISIHNGHGSEHTRRNQVHSQIVHTSHPGAPLLFVHELHIEGEVHASVWSLPSLAQPCRLAQLLCAVVLVIAAGSAIGVAVALSSGGTKKDSTEQRPVPTAPDKSFSSISSMSVEAAMQLPYSKPDFTDAKQRKFRAGARLNLLKHQTFFRHLVAQRCC